MIQTLPVVLKLPFTSTRYIYWSFSRDGAQLNAWRNELLNSTRSCGIPSCHWRLYYHKNCTATGIQWQRTVFWPPSGTCTGWTNVYMCTSSSWLISQTDWDHQGLPRDDWEELLAQARNLADEAGFYRFCLPEEFGGKNGSNLWMGEFTPNSILRRLRLWGSCILD